MSGQATTPAAEPSPAPFPRGFHVLVTAAAAMIVVAGMRAFAASIGPIFLALVIVVVVSPIHSALRRRGAPPWVALLGLTAVSFGILLAILAALIWSISELVGLLSSEAYRAQMGEIQDDAANLLERVGVTGDDLEQAVGRLDFGAVAGQISSALSSILSLTSAIGLLVITLLFMVIDAARFDLNLAAVGRERPEVARGLQQFARQTRHYFVISTVFGLIVAAVDVAALMILGVPLALVWGILSLITNYIPNIGFVLGLIPPALLGYFEGGWRLALWVILSYAVINFVIQSVIQPKFVGDALGLSATLTFLSLIFWGWVLGPLGALLAVPMTLLAKALLIDIDPATRWAGPLISLPGTAGVEPRPLPPDFGDRGAVMPEQVDAGPPHETTASAEEVGDGHSPEASDAAGGTTDDREQAADSPEAN